MNSRCPNRFEAQELRIEVIPHRAHCFLHLFGQHVIRNDISVSVAGNLRQVVNSLECLLIRLLPN